MECQPRLYLPVPYPFNVWNCANEMQGGKCLGGKMWTKELGVPGKLSSNRTHVSCDVLDSDKF